MSLAKGREKWRGSREGREIDGEVRGREAYKSKRGGGGRGGREGEI